jgi:hypothetical protein
MIKRIALTIGSIAAAGVLALGLAAAGFGPTASVEADQAASAVDTGTADGLIAEPVAQVQTETIYIRPAPAPEVIHVTKRVPSTTRKSAAAQRSTQRASTRRENDGGEREEDD